MNEPAKNKIKWQNAYQMFRPEFLVYNPVHAALMLGSVTKLNKDAQSKSRQNNKSNPTSNDQIIQIWWVLAFFVVIFSLEIQPKKIKSPDLTVYRH